MKPNPFFFFVFYIPFLDFNPIDLIFDINGKRFLILTNDGVYQLKCPEKELSKVYDGDNLTAMTIKNNKIIVEPIN